MKKRLALFLWVCLTVSLATVAQESTPSAENIAPDNAQVNALLEQVAQQAANVEKGVDQAYNLLGLFEAIGVFITVGGGLAAIFGISQLFTARSELNATNKRLEENAHELSKRFDQEIKRREAELESLRGTLQKFTEEIRETTNRALVANSLIPLGDRQYKASDLTGAVNVYEIALERDRKNPITHQKMGYVRTQMGDLEAAKRHYEEALKEEPKLAPALAGLGFVYRKMAEKMPTTTESETRQQALKYNEAERLLLQALDITPRLVDDDGESWWGVLGGLYRRRKQYEQAIDAYKRATEVTPQSSYGYGNLAQLYLKTGNKAEMKRTYARVERIAETEASAEQGNFWGYADLVASRFAIGKITGAEEALQVAINIAPIDAPERLEGLRDTLKDLLNGVDQENIMPIRNAIATIELALADRAKQLKSNT